MKMLRVVQKELQLMFQFTRLNRQGYIAYIGFAYTSVAIVGILSALLIPINPQLMKIVVNNPAVKVIFAFWLLAVFFLPLWWLMRRINDTGSSAKWILKIIPISLLCI